VVQSVVVLPEEQLKLVAHHILVVVLVAVDSIHRSLQFEHIPDIVDSTVVVDFAAEPVVAAAVVVAAEELDTVDTDCRPVADRAS